jgi:hypothetical protein
MIALLPKVVARLPNGDSALRARLMARLAAALTRPRSVADRPAILELMRASTAMAHGWATRTRSSTSCNSWWRRQPGH